MQFTVTQHGNMELASVNELLDQGWLLKSIQHVANTICQFSGRLDNGVARDSQTAMLESRFDDCGKPIPSIRISLL